MREIKFRAWDKNSNRWLEPPFTTHVTGDEVPSFEIIGNVYENPELLKTNRTKS